MRPARHQWFWSGSQEDTRVLTPDLKQSVKRHVVVTRKVPVDRLQRFNLAGLDKVKKETKDPSDPLQSILGDHPDPLLNYVRALNEVRLKQIEQAWKPSYNAGERDLEVMKRAVRHGRTAKRELLERLLQFEFSVSVSASSRETPQLLPQKGKETTTSIRFRRRRESHRLTCDSYARR